MSFAQNFVPTNFPQLRFFPNLNTLLLCSVEHGIVGTWNPVLTEAHDLLREMLCYVTRRNDASCYNCWILTSLSQSPSSLFFFFISFFHPSLLRLRRLCSALRIEQVDLWRFYILVSRRDAFWLYSKGPAKCRNISTQPIAARCNIVGHKILHKFGFPVVIYEMVQQGSLTRKTCCAQQCCTVFRWNVACVSGPGLENRNLFDFFLISSSHFLSYFKMVYYRLCLF